MGQKNQTAPALNWLLFFTRRYTWPFNHEMDANKTLARSLTQNTPLIAAEWSATTVGGLTR